MYDKLSFERTSFLKTLAMNYEPYEILSEGVVMWRSKEGVIYAHVIEYDFIVRNFRFRLFVPEKFDDLPHYACFSRKGIGTCHTVSIVDMRLFFPTYDPDEHVSQILLLKNFGRIMINRHKHILRNLQSFY